MTTSPTVSGVSILAATGTRASTDRELVASWVDGLTSEHSKRNFEATAQQYVLRIKSLLSYAHRLGYTRFNAGVVLKPWSTREILTRSRPLELTTLATTVGLGASLAVRLPTPAHPLTVGSLWAPVRHRAPDAADHPRDAAPSL